MRQASGKFVCLSWFSTSVFTLGFLRKRIRFTHFYERILLGQWAGAPALSISCLRHRELGGHHQHHHHHPRDWPKICFWAFFPGWHSWSCQLYLDRHCSCSPHCRRWPHGPWSLLTAAARKFGTLEEAGDTADHHRTLANTKINKIHTIHFELALQCNVHIAFASLYYWI